MGTPLQLGAGRQFRIGRSLAVPEPSWQRPLFREQSLGRIRRRRSFPVPPRDADHCASVRRSVDHRSLATRGFPRAGGGRAAQGGVVVHGRRRRDNTFVMRPRRSAMTRIHYKLFALTVAVIAFASVGPMNATPGSGVTPSYKVVSANVGISTQVVGGPAGGVLLLFGEDRGPTNILNVHQK